MRKSTTTGIAMIIGGVALLISGLMPLRILNKEPVDIMNEDDWDHLEAGMHVSTTIDMVWDELYTETTTNYTNGIKTGEHESGRGYIIAKMVPVGKDDCDIGQFICYFAKNSKTYTTANVMLDESDRWFNDWIAEPADYKDYCFTTLEIEDGKLREMTDEEYNFFISYLMESGFTRSEAEDFFCPLVLEDISRRGVYISAGVGGLIAVLGVVILVVGHNIEKKEQNFVFNSKPSSTSSISFGTASDSSFSSEPITFDDPALNAAHNNTASTSSNVTSYGQQNPSTSSETDMFGNPVNPGTAQSTNQYGYGNQSTPATDMFGNPVNPGTTQSTNQYGYGNQSTPTTDMFGNPVNPGATQSTNQYGYGNQSTPATDMFGNPVNPNPVQGTNQYGYGSSTNQDSVNNNNYL